MKKLEWGQFANCGEQFFHINFTMSLRLLFVLNFNTFLGLLLIHNFTMFLGFILFICFLDCC